MEGPLIVVPDSFTGREDVGPSAPAIAAALGTPREIEPDVGAIRAALSGRPVVIASECSIALATLPWVAQEHPEATVVWIDAHPDFNTPDTSLSGYGGGMGVAGAAGLWEAGVTPALPTERLVFVGLRDVDPGERMLLDGSAAQEVEPTPEAVLAAVGDAPVFVHLDPDVIQGYPGAFPSPPGGPTAEQLRAVTEALARDRRVVGVSVASAAGPVEPVLSVLEPLL